MTPLFNWIGESTQQDAMRLAGLREPVVCLYDGRNDEPKVFLVVTQGLLDAWQRELDRE